MIEENNLPEEEKFSDDPEEDLRMQNDFLKMKMMAESRLVWWRRRIATRDRKSVPEKYNGI